MKPRAAAGQTNYVGRKNRHPRPSGGARKPLWELSITASSEAEDAVVELIARILGCPACSFTNVDSTLTTVTAFLDSTRLWSEMTRQKLRAELQRISHCGLSVKPGKICFRKIKRRDWAHAWKHHFKPIRVGAALVVRPSWSRLRVQQGQCVVVIDPGLSFGTGHHPTTRFCLQQLVTHRGSHAHRSFLDLGTGSGLLAIAAAKLGYAPVSALDFDPDAVIIARENARRNRLAGKISFRRQDIARLPRRGSRRYSVICANLTTPLLLAQRARILARLEKGGVLILAGILKSEFESVRAAYTSAGLRLMERRLEKEWRSGTFANAAD